MFTSRKSKPKFFVASSSAAKPIAEKLSSKLEKIAEVVPWWRGFPPGKLILPALLDHARNCDFAAVLLTEDDLAKPKEARDSRDNCIFELGLFTGALGLNSERAFILTSAKKGTLPDDLQGVIYLPIKEPTGADKPEEVEEADRLLENAYQQIKSSVEALKYCYEHPKLRILPTDHLLLMERPEGEGGDLVYDDNRVGVIVYADQPIERDHHVAGIVLDNMEEQVDYTYFFEADERYNLKLLPPLIRTLAAAKLKVDHPKTRDPEYWTSQMMASPQAMETVKRCLKQMKRHLQIYLLAHKAAIQFCIHNADDKNRAICYLRYPPKHFVQWCTGSNANDVVADLRTKGVTAADDYIFQESSSFNLYNDANRAFTARLRKKTLEQFPEDLHPHVAEACFRPET